MIPKDPMILVSYINSQLRDFYPSLEELCESMQISEKNIKASLMKIDYVYDKELNQFV